MERCHHGPEVDDSAQLTSKLMGSARGWTEWWTREGEGIFLLECYQQLGWPACLVASAQLFSEHGSCSNDRASCPINHQHCTARSSSSCIIKSPKPEFDLSIKEAWKSMKTGAEMLMRQWVDIASSIAEKFLPLCSNACVAFGLLLLLFIEHLLCFVCSDLERTLWKDFFQH